MDNPWKQIRLDDYENHMKLASVMQLQAMNEMMRDQFRRYAVRTVMILGVAGGNGLEHISPGAFDKVYGVDVNPLYLDQCVRRYPDIKHIFQPIEADLSDTSARLPCAGLVIANLFIEYTGYEAFRQIVHKVNAGYISCVIQSNPDTDFVSGSPYQHVFDHLKDIHHQISPGGLSDSMRTIGCKLIFEDEKPLPNNKRLIRLDYKR